MEKEVQTASPLRVDISTKKFPDTFTLIDAEDYEKLGGYKWHPQIIGRTMYVTRVRDGKMHYLHRVIANPGPDFVVDHINHNGLDNRKANLRCCSRAENARNSLKYRCSNRYKGVYYHQRTGSYLATIRRDGKSKYLGLFKHEIDAAKAYNEAAKEAFGAFASLNEVA